MRQRREVVLYGRRRRVFKKFFLDVGALRVRTAGQGNDFELIPTVKVETRHPIEGPFGREFSSIYIVS